MDECVVFTNITAHMNKKQKITEDFIILSTEQYTLKLFWDGSL